MDDHFEQLHENIKLTKAQRDDVKTKRSGVSRSLFDEFYEGEYNSDTRLTIGSHGKFTETRYPVGDLDLIFKISAEDLDRYQNYESNGPSALLQRARNRLKLTYPTTSIIRSWGKVVLIEFDDGSHNVEVLPCYENDDGTFTIPNSEGNDGKGSWENFDPRQEMRTISESQKSTGLTRRFIRMAKRWKRKSNLNLKSYQIEFYVVSFLDESFGTEKSWTQLFEEFFLWLEQQSADYDESDSSKISRARARAQNAREYELLENYESACAEWRKVFGTQFPSYDETLATVKALEREYPTDEEFIHEMFNMKIDPTVELTIHADYQEGRADPHPFAHFFRNTGSSFKKHSRFFFRVSSTLGKEARYFWKVRNFHDDARDAGELRGKIIDKGQKITHEEGALYVGTHYVDCYAVVDDVVVAQARRFVPIGRDSLNA